MYYTGLDIHKERTQIQHMDGDGTLGISMNIPTEAKSLLAFLEQLDAPTAVCLEATGSSWWISRLLMDHPRVARLAVVDPRRSRHLAEELSVQSGYGRAKNDRIDAEMLAELLRRDIAPAIHLPGEGQMECRALCRHRLSLVQQRTRACSRIQAILTSQGVRICTRLLLEDLEAQQAAFQRLPGYAQFSITDLLNQIRLYQQQIDAGEIKLNKLLPPEDPQVLRLLSAPGIGPILARIIICEISDIARFREPKYLISYAGLAPVVAESAGKRGRVALNPHCNHYLKYAFMMAAHAARRHPRYRHKYQKDVKYHGKIRAKINLARRIAKAVYWMLTRQQCFE